MTRVRALADGFAVAGMTNYRCVFTYANGNTTITVPADSADNAILNAVHTVGVEGVRTIEAWGPSGLVAVCIVPASAIFNKERVRARQQRTRPKAIKRTSVAPQR